MNKKTKDLISSSLDSGESSNLSLDTIKGKKVIIKYSKRSHPKNEIIALRKAKKANVAVPNVVKYTKGKIYLELLHARNIKKTDLNQKFFSDLSALLKNLHSIKVKRIGNLLSPHPYSVKNWLNFLKNQLQRNLKILVKNKKITSEDSQKLFKYSIEKLKVLPKRSFIPTLLHGDIHLYNILIGAKNKLFLIDFEDTIYGDPLYDLSIFSNFHPELFLKLKNSYNSPSLFSEGWKDWFDLYRIVHLIWLCVFYVDIENNKRLQKHWSKALILSKIGSKN